MTFVLRRALITSVVIISRVVQKHKTTSSDPANNLEGGQNEHAAADLAHAT